MAWRTPLSLDSHRGGENKILLRYGCAVVSIAVAVKIRLLLDPVLGYQFPYATEFFAVLVTAWYAGRGPALAAVAVGALAADYFLQPPRGSFLLEGLDQQVGMALFVGVGTGIAMLGGAMDAARRLAVVAARQARQQAALIEQTYDPVLVWDWNGSITFWNSGAERLYGFSQSEALGRVSHDLLRTKFPGGVSAFVEPLQSQSWWEGELEHTTRDGRSIVVDSRMVLVRDGARAYVIEANRDISERREAEAALREANDRLESRVRARTAELQATNQELEQFAYAASHDLKAPLRVIDNASRWLEEDLQQHLTVEIREHISLMRGRVGRMEKLLDDLLEYSRIGRTADERFGEIISGDVLMENILALISPPQGFTVHVSPNFRNIRVCRMPLQQILMNLVSNAIKHHDKKAGCIDAMVEDRGAHFAFALKDDGPGIPPRHHEQIFEMFQTLKPRDRVEGSGMGLAMVRKNIEVFGGTLDLDSSEGRGSTFRFTWPKHQQLSGEAA